MNKKRSSHLFLALVALGLLSLLAACGSGGLPATGNTPSSVVNGSPTHATDLPVATQTGFSGSSTTGSTVAMPSTVTTCPPAGTGRAAVMAHLQLGSHQNVVYVNTIGTFAAPSVSVLKRHDIVSGADIVIATLPGVYVDSPQVSADGQWILFLALSGSQDKLQLIRMDGRGLQTLYCSSQAEALNDAQWSTDQRLVVLEHYSNNGVSKDQITVLNLNSGNVQTDFTSVGGVNYAPITWLDNTRIYLSHQATDSPVDSLYLLDTSRGANQPASNLTLVYQSMPDSKHSACWSADSNYNGSTVFIAECGLPNSASHPGASAQEGPSTIFAKPATGGASHSIFSNGSEAIMMVRAVTRNTLLFVVDNLAFDSGVNVDTSHNGLWKINTDGSGLTQLASAGSLNRQSQFPWSNVSRDASLYSFQGFDGKTISLEFGSLNGGATTTFASIAAGGNADLAIVGWTTLG